MKNLKLELFNYKNSLSLEQDEIAYIVEAHIKYLDEYSEKKVVESLNSKLANYKYVGSVKTLLEGLNIDLEAFELMYELKDLYRTIESQNHSMIYRQPLNVLLQTINLDNDLDRKDKIVNELAMYDWVPEIKQFMFKISNTAEQRQKFISSGVCEPIYTITESVENGHIVFVKDSWFLLTTNGVDRTLLENHIKDEAKLRKLRMLENATNFCTISNELITFKLDENLSLSLSVKNKGELFINEEKTNVETTLESIFSSPIVPIVNKNIYPMIMEVASSIDSFVELDVVKKVSNLINPCVEFFAFNFANKIYGYRLDSRTGSNFYVYESAIELIKDVKTELNYDLTYFYENLVSKEVKVKNELDNKEMAIKAQLEDYSFNIEKIEATLVMTDSEELKEALTTLKAKRDDIQNELQAIKELQEAERINA